MKARTLQLKKRLQHLFGKRQGVNRALIGLITSSLLISGCTCNRHKGADKQASLATDSTLHDSTLVAEPFEHQQFVLDSVTSLWLSETMGGRQLNADDFKSREDSAVSNSAQAGEEASTDHFGASSQISEPRSYYAQFAPFTKSSPDSLYLIDFGSYNHIVTRDKAGHTKLEGAEPDSKVELLDFQAGIKWQILYGGPGLHIMDAKWKDNTHFMVLFSNEQNLGADTILLTGELNSKTIKWYKLGNQ